MKLFLFLWRVVTVYPVSLAALARARLAGSKKLSLLFFGGTTLVLGFGVASWWMCTGVE